MKVNEIIKLDKGEAHIIDGVCVNSKHRARFLASENEEYCQCGFGDCKVMVSISYNGHNPFMYILNENDIKSLPTVEVELSPDLKAKYIKEGYESCLREVKARVESLKKYTPQGGNMPDTYFSEGHNECLDEIKSLINEI